MQWRGRCGQVGDARVFDRPIGEHASPTLAHYRVSKIRPYRSLLVETVLFDLRFAARSLRRRPTFAAIAIATIALSIGAATSIYSVVDGVLFRSLPYHDARRLVAI